MATAVFPYLFSFFSQNHLIISQITQSLRYVNSTENTYGSFSVHTRIDFDSDLQKTSTTEQLLFIYDDFGHIHRQRSLSYPLV